MKRLLMLLMTFITFVSIQAEVHQKVDRIDDNLVVVHSVLPVEYEKTRLETISAVGIFSEWLKVCPVYVPDEALEDRPTLVWNMGSTFIFISPSNSKPWVGIRTVCNQDKIRTIKEAQLILINLILELFSLEDSSSSYDRMLFEL